MSILGSNNHIPIQDKVSTQRRQPRICMLTTRNFALNAWRCAAYECQDVLLEVDDVDLLYLKPGKAHELREAIQRDLIWHDFTKKAVSINMAYHPIRLNKEYDLFIAYVPHYRDLIHISAIKGWKDQCKTSICWIEEFWGANVPELDSWLSALNQFDYVAIALKGTVNAVNDAIKPPCHWVSGAVDTIRFSPYPNPPDRVIDVYSIGRILEGYNQAFLNLASKNKIFYIYDTFNHATDSRVKDYGLHREMFANMAQRSQYFVVQPAKAGVYRETKEQIEVGWRYFEGAAAGAVMLGQIPYCEAYDIMFDWPDAVIEIEPDGSNVGDVLTSLAAQPEKLLKISRRNAKEALLRHDWVYRWEQILKIAGLEPMPTLLKRKEHLKNLADMIGKTES